eukprot:m.1357309 g.1357309  ORF g.1357309 m.1357309 type:complete len:124 (-) comp24933_c0_seq80:4199-4570(-)
MTSLVVHGVQRATFQQQALVANILDQKGKLDIAEVVTLGIPRLRMPRNPSAHTHTHNPTTSHTDAHVYATLVSSMVPTENSNTPSAIVYLGEYTLVAPITHTTWPSDKSCVKHTQTHRQYRTT